ncbi:MAG TPA: CPBP family intramembrane glutamic endopeptidase, partial [Gemmatimonadaceae bacterium]|nr:CPBP family intramembrane glutamic endopeptidase [Gemmatimonadaceae bacterium]
PRVPAVTGSWLRTDAGMVRAPWRVVAFGTAVAASSFVFLGVALPMATATPLAGWARAARIPLDQVATVACLVAATWLTGRLVHGERDPVWPHAGLTRGAWRPRVLAAAFAAGTLVILLPALALVAVGAARFEPATATDGPLTVAWAALALLIPAAAAEELLFRGYAFDACRAGMGPRGAVAVTSVGFALAHLLNPDPTIASVAAVACAGVFLAIVRLTTGSLVAAVLAHLGVNYAQAVGLHAAVSGLALQTPAYRYVPTGPDWLTGGAWGPEAGAGVVVALAVASFRYATSRQTAEARR